MNPTSFATDRQDQMNRWRPWIFRITAIIIPALFLVFLEIGLRIFGVGYPTSFTVKRELNDRTVYYNNDTFTRLFFPPKLARPSIPFVVPAEKGAKTYRIFVLGGSAAQGDPEHTFGFSRILEVMLRGAFPRVDFEIVNAAVTAINSHVVLEMAKDLAHHESDLFIVYLGNNEVVGPFGPGTVFTPLSPNLWLIRASIFVKSTAVGQTLEKLWKFVVKEKTTPTDWEGMEMFLAKQVHADDPRMETVYRHFQKNLEGILGVARKAGVKTIVSTVGSNLKDSAPFASLHRADISEEEKKAWETLYQSGIELESAHKYEEAIQRYVQAARIDARFADLQYRLGRCSWMLANYEEARKRYLRARDLDTLRFRADTHINDIIRTVAGGRAAEAIYLVDANGSFQETSPHSTPGKELFYDHVHMNFGGNYVLARSVFQKVVEVLPPWVRRSEHEGQPFTEAECAKRLAFTPYDRQRVADEVLKRLRRPPFSNQIYHEEQIKHVQKDLHDLQTKAYANALMESASQYRTAIQEAGSDPWLHYNYALLLQASRSLPAAAEQLRLFMGSIPFYVQAYESLAKILILQEKLEDAIRECQKALEISPEFAPVHYHMAFALAKQGKFIQSIETYQKLISIDPDMTADIHNQKGKILAQLGRFDEAVETFREALGFNAESPFKKDVADIHFNLGHVLKRLDRSEESILEFRRAVHGYRKKISQYPNSSETHTVLGKALAETGDYRQAAKHFREALESDSANVAKHMNLIRALERQGRVDEAIDALQTAIRSMSSHGQPQAAATLQRYVKVLQSRTSGRNQS